MKIRAECKIMPGFIKKLFIAVISFSVLLATRCSCLNNQPYMTRPTHSYNGS